MIQARKQLSVVIPVAPGDDAWRGLLPQLEALSGAQVVLVFAEDLPIAELNFVGKMMRAPLGRALQLNAGANACESDYIWFLHADSGVSEVTVNCLTAFVAKRENAIGYFDLHFLPDGPRGTAINAWAARWRSRLFGMPFGDQGFVMSRACFEQLGGFDPTVQRGEDHALTWRAKRLGISLRRLPAPIFTSARKYAEKGWWRTTVAHQFETWRQARTFYSSYKKP
jgi:Glycosyl transferase family 21